MDIVAPVLCAIVGFFATSALHIVRERSPMHESYRRVPVHCGACGVAVNAGQRWPLLATLRSDNRCKTCHATLFSGVGPFELGGALLAGAAGVRFGFEWWLPAYVVFFIAVYLISVIDYQTFIIPNKVVYPSFWACLTLTVVAAAASGKWSHLLGALAGMAGAWFFLLLLVLFYPAGMGFGDVRLSLLTGLMTGFLSPVLTIMGVFYGFALGGVVGLLLVVFRFRTRKDAVPFGPFLAIGAGIAVLFGGAILRATYG